MTENPRDIIARYFRGLSEAEIVQALQGAPLILIRYLELCLSDALWVPLPGPQLDAYFCDAYELLYGGSAGGGKSALICGLAVTAHKKSMIFRRDYTQLKDLIGYMREILSGTPAKYNGQEKIFRSIPGDRTVEFGAVQHEEDKVKFKGRPHDLKAFDELSEFTETQYQFLIGWTRTTLQGQRTRVVSSSNPPTNAEGEWIIRRWAPWLDPQHSNPAAPGELRWFAMVDGKEQEVEDGTPFNHKNELILPNSRTFIPARLTDNPFLLQTGYGAILQNMPEPLRSQLLYGDFQIGVEDDPWQVIPTEWVRMAQKRWQEHAQPEMPCSSIGVDVARGGRDKTVIAKRYGHWFADLKKYPGQATPNGKKVAALIEVEWDGVCPLHIDVVGVGSSVYDAMDGDEKPNVFGLSGAEKSEKFDRSGRLPFKNLRAEQWWKLREALDPELGDDLALPPDRELLADLCAPRWELRAGKIQIEEKDDIIQRIGRSPDCGDAVVLAHWEGRKKKKLFQGHKATGVPLRPQVDTKPVDNIYEEIILPTPQPAPRKPAWTLHDLLNNRR